MERVGPAFGRELVQPLWAEQDVLQILERGHVDEFAALDERVHERGAMGAGHTPREEPVLAADRDDTPLILGAPLLSMATRPSSTYRSSAVHWFVR